MSIMKPTYINIMGYLLSVQVDKSALIDISTLPMTLQPSNGKVKIKRRGGTNYSLGSLPEQLYGSSYRYAQHIADDPYDLRRSAFAQSKARLKRMKQG